MAWTKWRKFVSQQTQSGQTVAAFCRARGLCAGHFYWWRKRLSEAEAQTFVEMKVISGTLQPPAAGAGIEVRLKNDLRVLDTARF